MAQRLPLIVIHCSMPPIWTKPFLSIGWALNLHATGAAAGTAALAGAMKNASDVKTSRTIFIKVAIKVLSTPDGTQVVGGASIFSSPSLRRIIVVLI